MVVVKMKVFRRHIDFECTGQQGFSLAELLIAVAITGILAALAAPSFSDLMKGQKIKSMATDINVSLMRARSEAVKRNRNVTMTPTTAWAWQDGWTIADPDNAGSNIEVRAATSGLTVTGPDNVTYMTSGRIQGVSAPSFDIRAAGTSTRSCVTVDLSGRPYVKAAAC
ncbi:MAG: GspH/FimT family pseudopilin [Pseudomonadota bacterium]